jgi:hypothetical protein
VRGEQLGDEFATVAGGDILEDVLDVIARTV